MTLGERIKEHRKRIGFSQEKIAELVGTSRQAVTKWEANQSIPCMENLITLAEIFGISLSELSNGVKENIPHENNAEPNSHDKPKKSPLVMDIVFILVAIFAVWNILKIPSLIGFSIVGFFTIVIQAAAILYIPIYLLWIRPRRAKVINSKQYNENMKFGKKIPIKERLLWAVGAIASLWICYVLWYILSSNDIITVLSWQFLRGWSFNLFVFGAIIIFIAMLTFARKIMISTVTGYAVGLVLAIFFNSDTFDPNPGIYVNNAWFIWTATYLIAIVAGVACEVVNRYIKKVAK